MASPPVNNPAGRDALFRMICVSVSGATSGLSLSPGLSVEIVSIVPRIKKSATGQVGNKVAPQAHRRQRDPVSDFGRMPKEEENRAAPMTTAAKDRPGITEKGKKSFHVKSIAEATSPATTKRMMTLERFACPIALPNS